MRTNSPETLIYASKEECILVFLATGEKTSLGKDIQDAYNTWQKLTPSYKWDMNMQMQRTLKSSAQKELYHSLIRGFDIWDHTQNMDGAPGWRIQESSINEVVKHIGEDMLCLLHAMEGVWMNRKKKVSKILKTSALRSTDSESSILATDRKCIKVGGKGDSVATGTRNHNSFGMGAKGLPDCLPSLSNEEKVEKFRKDHFEQELDISGKQSLDESLLETSQVADGHHDDLNESIIPAISKLKDSIDVSLEENSHLQNLRLSDCQDDSDFERQISPLISGDEA